MKTLTPRDKPQLRELAPTGWFYSGYWDGFYHYGKGSYTANGGEFYDMRVINEDLTIKNLALMAKLGVSR